MELVKKTPSTFETKGNNSSQPLGDSPAIGVEFSTVKVEPRSSSGGNANTTKPVPGGEK